MHTPEVHKTEEAVEKAVENVAQTLDIHISNERDLPLSLRIFALLMIIGGLSILGGSFTDFLVANGGGFFFNLYRTATGIAFLLVAYSIYRRSRWALWIYGTLVFIGLLINFSVAIIPALLVLYLYIMRSHLRPCPLDVYTKRTLEGLKARYSLVKKI